MGTRWCCYSIMRIRQFKERQGRALKYNCGNSFWGYFHPHRSHLNQRTHAYCNTTWCGSLTLKNWGLSDRKFLNSWIELYWSIMLHRFTKGTNDQIREFLAEHHPWFWSEAKTVPPPNPRNNARHRSGMRCCFLQDHGTMVLLLLQVVGVLQQGQVVWPHGRRLAG